MARRSQVLFFAYFLILLSCSDLVWRSEAYADDWRPDLLPSPHGTHWLPKDPIEIQLPADTTGDRLGRLALELNSYDVSDLVSLDGMKVVLLPPQPFGTGDNHLRLVEYQDDGGFVIHAEWTFNVRASEAFQDIAAGAQLSAEANYRLASANLENLPDRLTARGGASVNGLVGGKSWRTEATSNFIYSSEIENSIAGRQFDIGEYLLSGEINGSSLDYGAALGHQGIGTESLLVNGFYRRGGIIDIATSDGLASFTAFAMQSEPTVGFKHLNGVGDKNNRADGFHVALRPSFEATDAFELSATYYSGKDLRSGTGISGEDVQNSGSGYSFALDSLWLDNRLNLHAELAFTEFDFDGDGSGFEPEKDNAHHFLASYMPLQGIVVADEYMDLTIGVEYDRVGTFYRTITNPSIVEDLNRTALFAEFGWGTFALSGSMARETNNVDDNDLIPTNRAYDFNMAANYAPTIEHNDGDGEPWYGQPNFGLSLSHYDIKQIKTPSDFRGNTLNNYTSSATANAGFNYAGGYWGLGHTISTFQDQTNLASNTINHFTDLSGFVSVGERLKFSPSLQWGIFRDQAFDAETHNLNAGLGMDVSWISGVLDSRFNYTINLQTGSNDTPDRHIILGDLVWVMLPPKDNRPGFEFSLSGQLDKQNDDVDDGLPDTVYQIFGTLRMTFATEY